MNLCFVAPDYPDQGQFSWSHYLQETGAKAVAAEAFKVVRTENKCTFDLNNILEIELLQVTPLCA